MKNQILFIIFWVICVSSIAQIQFTDNPSNTNQNVSSCGNSISFDVKVDNKEINTSLPDKDILVTIQVKQGVRIDTAFNSSTFIGYQLISANSDRTQATYLVPQIASNDFKDLTYSVSAQCGSISASSYTITTDSVFAVNANLSTDFATPIQITGYTVYSPFLIVAFPSNQAVYLGQSAFRDITFANTSEPFDGDFRFEDSLTVTSPTLVIDSGYVVNTAIVSDSLLCFEVLGCTNSQASNYNPDATTDDGSCILGVSNRLSNSIITIYPNPVQNKVVISLSEKPTNLTYQLINQIGETLQSDKINELNTELDISTYPSGKYTIVIQQGKQIISKKIIIL